MAKSGDQDQAKVPADPAVAPDTELSGLGPDGLFLDPPASTARIYHSVQPGQFIGARFPSTAAETHLTGADLVLDFLNGGEIVLQGYLDALRAGNPPILVFQDGTLYAPPAQSGQAASAPAESDLGVASGPGAQIVEPGAGPRGGSHAYEDDFGSRTSGLQISGTLPTPGPVETSGLFAAGPSTGPRTPPPTAADPRFFEPESNQAQIQPEADQPQVGPVAPPTPSLRLIGGVVDELPLTGIPVAIVRVSNPIPGDSHSFALIDDAGGRFAIGAASGLISTTVPLDFETAPSHVVVVRVIGSAGTTISQSFTITVNDLNEIFGSAGADALNGTALPDMIDGLGDDDLIDAGDGNDYIFGGIGRDILNGGAGDDVLFGESENDILNGGSGADSLLGGSGNDVLQVDAQDFFIDGGTGIDRVEVQGAAGVTLDLTASSIELAIGGAGNDSFDATGSNFGVRQDGGGGGDVLIGGNLGDRLRGEGGNDTLLGGAGDDSLDGGPGDDDLTGGSGADVFAIDLSFAGGLIAAAGSDVVTDLSSADVLSFRGVLDLNGDLSVDLADLAGHVGVATAGTITTLTFDGGGSVALEGLGGAFNSIADLLAGGFILEALP